MAIIWRTDGPWGTGIDEDLTAEQIDNNFYQLVLDIAEKAVQGVGIVNFVVNGNLFTVVLTDHTLLGPYELPVVSLHFFGEWLPETDMLANYIFTHNGSTYITLENHTTAMTFDPGANDGDGNDLYGLLLQNPTLVIPSGGAVGAFLRKLSVDDWDTYWGTAALSELSDVFLPESPEPEDGDVLTYSGGLWISSTPVTALSQLSDVLILDSPGPETGQALTWNGSAWTNDFSAFLPNILSPAAGQLLVYDGVAEEWQNKNTADLPVGMDTSVFGTITLDYSEGPVQRVTMTGGTTLSTVSNWPPAGQFGRLVLQIYNTGAYTWTWPVAYRWPGGAAPDISVSGRDIYALTTFDGGATVDGSIIGQNYL